jgi:hypothetical protein
MEMNKKPWPITTTFGMRSKIDTNPDYQRPSVWSTSQKQLLMDTILQGYDIPKIYIRKVSSDKYEVVDGQQRLRAIWSFINNEFRLGKETDSIKGINVAGKYYNELPIDVRSDFDIYPLDVIVISDSDEEEVREMFLRLQNGTTLKAQEKRNAMPGDLRNFVKELVNHNLFTKSVNFSNKRFTHDQVAAQICLLEINGNLCNIKDKDLNKLYENNVVFDKASQKAKKIIRVLDYLFEMFPTKTPELERYNVISLYIIISSLMEKYAIKGLQEKLRNWFIDFEQYRHEQEELPEEDCDNEIISYHEKISHSTDALDSLEWRNKYLTRLLFEKIPNIEPKDNQRMFDNIQRLAIYRRDKGICQLKIKCNGKKCEWDNWHADHIIPWSKGGKTTVENGQVACPECNLSKGADD